jgi:hypothetical protein
VNFGKFHKYTCKSREVIKVATCSSRRAVTETGSSGYIKPFARLFKAIMLQKTWRQIDTSSTDATSGTEGQSE